MKLLLISAVIVLVGCSSAQTLDTRKDTVSQIGDWTVSRQQITGVGVDSGSFFGDYGFKKTPSGTDKVLVLKINNINGETEQVNALFVSGSFTIVNAKRYYVTTWSTDKAGLAVSFEEDYTDKFKLCFSPESKEPLCYNGILTKIKL